jgi:hypothetical protein
LFDIVGYDYGGTTAMDRPKLTLERLAAITDAKQIEDIRAATDGVLAA